MAEKNIHGYDHGDIATFKKSENGGIRDSRHVHWMIMEDGNNKSMISDPDSNGSMSSFEDSGGSITSSCSSSEVMEDDASSPSSPSSPSPPYGPLYELSELMAHLPIKRGLSKYYQGKSQSFGSLASVKSLEDLAKKMNPYNKRMKSCKSYGGGLMDHGHKINGPKPTITKKKSSSSRGPLFMNSSSSLGDNMRSSFVGSYRTPSISLGKE